MTWTHATRGTSQAAPFSTYQVTGPAPQIFYQIINNTSFENGIQPWSLVPYNNFTPGMNLVSPGYGDNSAVQLNVNSGNLTVDSHLILVQDLSKATVVFGTGLRLRAASQVQTLTGSSITDRSEVSLTLSSSTGTVARIHYVFASGTLPANTTSDAYIGITGGLSNWISLDRDIANDTNKLFPTLSQNINGITDVELSVFSTSQGTPTIDPRIKYWETGGDSYWNTTETVVYDPDTDGKFNATTDWILYNQGIPSTGQVLSNDPLIKYVDKNVNGRWDPGEPIVYDKKNEGVYDLANNDPVINGTAVAGSLLQDPIRQQTKSMFDQVELYTQSEGINWIHNGGFETGDLTGWGNIAGFKTVSTPVRSGSYSANGTISGTTAALAESIDGRPAIDSTTSLQASAYIGKMTGASSSDRADIWLGLVDSSPQASPLSIYYYFKTGTGTIPVNTTDTVTHPAPGYGTLTKWLNLTRDILPETRYFDAKGHTGPYRIEAVLLEVSSQQGSTTSANFDDVSLHAATPSTGFAVDGLNSTYIYQANSVPQGSFYFKVPGQQTVLNITSPNATPLQASDYTTQPLQGSLQITVPTATGARFSLPGNWLIYTTSKNALANLFATGSGSTSPSSSFDPGSKIDIATQTKDPSGQPIPGSNVTLLYSVGTTRFIGTTDNHGWFNETSITLPSNGGTVTLEAITVSPTYIGLRTTQLTINNTFPWALIIYIAIAAGAAVVFSVFFFRQRQRINLSPASTTKAQSKKEPKQPQTKIRDRR